MKYESARTEKGNVGVSFESQEAADNQALQMDANGNSNCYNCSDCSDCSRCSDCSGCSYCYNCSGCSYCSRCYNCSGCSGCSDCSDCSGILRWEGGEVSKLIALNGLRWPIAISKERIQIGCKNYTIEEWKNFKEAEIKAMDPDALEFWRENKELIISVADRAKRMKGEE